ncbi:MAG: hypothetical protein WCL17_01195 [Actinomycetota bacterium]
MTGSFKVPAILIAVAAFVLSATGVVLAATDSNPHGYQVDPLSLHGYVPKSADIQITIAANSSPLITGEMQVDFGRSVGDLKMGTSVLGIGAQLHMILAHEHVYLVNGGTLNRPYVNLGKVGVSWLGVSFEMAHPQVNLLAGAGAHDTVTTNAQGETVHTLNLTSGSLKLGGNLSMGSVAKLVITVGRGGELTGVKVQLRSQKSSEDITLKVLSYNQKVQVTAPRPSQIPTKSGGLGQLLKLLNVSSAIGGLTKTA